MPSRSLPCREAIGHAELRLQAACTAAILARQWLRGTDARPLLFSSVSWSPRTTFAKGVSQTRATSSPSAVTIWCTTTAISVRRWSRPPLSSQSGSSPFAAHANGAAQAHQAVATCRAAWSSRCRRAAAGRASGAPSPAGHPAAPWAEALASASAAAEPLADGRRLCR